MARTIAAIEEEIRNTPQQDCGPLYKELEEAQGRREKVKDAVTPGVPEKPQPGQPAPPAPPAPTPHGQPTP